MKKLALLFSLVLFNTCCFTAYASTTSHTLNDWASAWNTQSTVQLQKHANDMHIVYGGEDISKKPLLLA